MKSLGKVWTGAAIGCVEESRKELEFQVYCFIALRLGPRHLMHLNLSLLIFKDERIIALAAKVGMRMPKWYPSERYKGQEQMAMSSPSISTPELDTDSERHCTGRGENSRPEHDSCIKGWTISSLERLRKIQKVNNIR